MIIKEWKQGKFFRSGGRLLASKAMKGAGKLTYQSWGGRYPRVQAKKGKE